MHSFSTIKSKFLLASGLAATLGCAAVMSASAQNATPDFMQGGIGWNAAGGMEAMPGPAPVSQDPKVKYVPNNVGGQPTWRYADVNNPNLTDFAKDGLKKANQMVDSGFALYNRTSRCWQPGIPSLDLSPGRIYFLQTPKMVYIIWQRDQIVRHVLMNQQHTRNPALSWNGESIGRYENGELVVDTIGQTTKSFVDLYRTPHSDKLHVVERFKMIEGGSKLQVELTVDDPATFKQPWKATRTWAKVPQLATNMGNVTGTYNEEIRCMDGEMVNPLNKEYAAKLEPLPTDKDGAEQKLLAGG
jgi:hypothetical protein